MSLKKECKKITPCTLREIKKKHLSINESKQLFHYHDFTIETNQIYTFNMRYRHAFWSLALWFKNST